MSVPRPASIVNPIAMSNHERPKSGAKPNGPLDWFEEGITNSVHGAEDWVSSTSHGLANRVADVPVVGALAKGAADQVSFNAEMAGGAVGGATSLVGGLADAALHPMETLGGLEAVGEHIP